MYIKAVGAHPSRVSNLYFTFLFVARAVAKAGSALTRYDYAVGNETERAAVEELMQQLVTIPDIDETNLTMSRVVVDAARQCKTGFDESALFQVRQCGDI